MIFQNKWSRRVKKGDIICPWRCVWLRGTSLISGALATTAFIKFVVSCFSMSSMCLLPCRPDNIYEFMAIVQFLQNRVCAALTAPGRQMCMYLFVLAIA